MGKSKKFVILNADVQPYASGVARALVSEKTVLTTDNLKELMLFYKKNSFECEVTIDDVTDVEEEKTIIESYEELIFYIKTQFKENLKDALYYRVENKCYPVTCIKRNREGGYYLHSCEQNVRSHKSLEYLESYGLKYWNELKREAWMLPYESVVDLPISVSHNNYHYNITGIEVSDKGVIINTILDCF